ncbi:MAG TPA: hypothetical protein VFU03_01450 [Gemmatimonadales bacterium]|nr:hypothetical protein [Gemmatimonadales bacterium]
MTTRSAGALSRLLLVSSFLLAGCSGDSTSPSSDPDQRIVALHSGVLASCALTASGSLRCWGQAFWDYDSILVSPSSISGNLTVSDFSLGTDIYGTSACAVTEGLATYCWGEYAVNWEQYAPYGPPPALLQDSLPLVRVTLGDGHGCGLTAAGAAYCWGSYSGGKRGNGAPVPVPAAGNTVPNQVVGGLTFLELAATRSHTCGLTAQHEVYCWGLDPWLGESGGPRYDTFDDCAFYQYETTCAWEPIKVTALTAVQQISAGGFGTCALSQVGTVLCWGPDPVAFPPAADLPSQVPLPESVTQVSVGGAHACALATTGVVYCWGGHNGAGADPTPVATSLRFTSISAGGSHTCGIARNERVYCWGGNGSGQLGGGIGNPSSTPVEVRFE